MSRVLFLTHADVRIDPQTPVPDWGLSERGAARHASFAQSEHVAAVTAIYSSCERKAIEGAAPLAAQLGIAPVSLEALGENDRSATGYLPKAEFEAMADAFFARPDESVSGWERARAAQARIVGAIRTLAALDHTAGDLCVVAHGGVGALLRCHLMQIEITRGEDQPANGGGNWFATDRTLTTSPSPWCAI